MRSKIKLSIIMLLMLVSCVNQSDTSSNNRKPISVKTLIVSSSNNRSGNTYIATIHSNKTTVVFSHNSGTIKELAIKQGDKVSKQDTLAIIDSPTINSTYEIAKATLDQAKDGIKRAENVYKAGGISEVKMVEIQTQYKQALSSYKAASNALNKCTLVSDFDAYIEEVYVESGQAVDVLQTVAKLVDINNLAISFSVPESEIGNIQEGQEISVEIPALGIKNFNSTISSKGISANILSHTYNCTATIDNNDSNILPGMLCKVRIEEDSDDIIIIPSEVLLIDINGKYVWVVEDGKVQKRNVEVDGFASNGVIISSGLKIGDQIIVEGYQKVSTGMVVTPKIATAIN